MKKLLLLLFTLGSVNLFAGNFDALKDVAVQDGGRIKPFDTFARESMQLVYGKQKMKGKSSIEVVFTWMLLPDVWANMEILHINYGRLKDDLDLPRDKKYFTPSGLMSHPKLPTLIQEVNAKQEAKERLNSYDQAIQQVAQQISQFQAIANGLHPGFIPVGDSVENKWKSFNKFEEEEVASFTKITKAFVEIIRSQEAKKDVTTKDLEAAVKGFVDSHQKIVDHGEVATEIHYNSLAPFKWSWIIYLLSVLCLFFYSLLKKEKSYMLGVWLMAAGFVIHTYGFLLRMYLTGRPPVSNMYETVIWVAWGAVLFAGFFEWKKKNRFMLISAGIVAVLCMIVADFAPSVLDASLQPLEPVLRSNLWLTVHVLTITIAYAAFFLAFILGDIALVYILKGEKKYKKNISELADAIYRAEKIGVVLLAAGTILGGVWADYSWGRFWGWDPKETWALIALLGYLALLHAKQGGHVRKAGLIAGSVVSFSLVIMAWYGVNYVLGAGLHSYGFGGGGLEYVAGFVGIHFLYVAFVMAARTKEK